MERQTTPPIAGQTSLHKSPFSSKGKVPSRNKYNRSIKPNKFHFKYVCFGSQRTLFGFPEMLMVRSVTTAARKVVSSSTLTGPFKSERECEQPLSLRVCSNSNGPIRVDDETTSRAAVVADLITSVSGNPKRQILRQISRSSWVIWLPKHTYFEWNLLAFKVDGTSFSDAGSLVTTAQLTREICPRDLKYRKSKTNMGAQKLLTRCFFPVCPRLDQNKSCPLGVSC